MSRTPIAVDHDELESAIQMVEENGPLPSLVALYNAVSQVMGGDVSSMTVRSRIMEWKIPIKTQQSRPSPNAAHKPIVETDNIPGYAYRLKNIYTPAGKCPYRLPEINYDAVADWCQKVRNHGIEHGICYATDALIYFARQFFDINENDYKMVRANIEEWHLTSRLNNN